MLFTLFLSLFAHASELTPFLGAFDTYAFRDATGIESKCQRCDSLFIEPGQGTEAQPILQFQRVRRSPDGDGLLSWEIQLNSPTCTGNESTKQSEGVECRTSYLKNGRLFIIHLHATGDEMLTYQKFVYRYEAQNGEMEIHGKSLSGSVHREALRDVMDESAGSLIRNYDTELLRAR